MFRSRCEGWLHRQHVLGAEHACALQGRLGGYISKYFKISKTNLNISHKYLKNISNIPRLGGGRSVWKKSVTKPPPELSTASTRLGSSISTETEKRMDLATSQIPLSLARVTGWASSWPRSRRPGSEMTPAFLSKTTRSVFQLQFLTRRKTIVQH